MLVAVRRLFSWNFQFLENGTVVCEMEASWWRETAELDLDDGRYSFYRDQVVDGYYVLERNTPGQSPFAQRSNLPSDWTVLDRAFLFWLCS